MYENNCTFNAITGTDCGSNSKERIHNITAVPLLECHRDISSHKSQLSFQGVATEVQLVLARCGIYDPPENTVSWNICPRHRASLGVDWKRSSRKCTIPGILSKHSPRVSKRPNAERGLSKDDSHLVYKETGIFLAPGSGN